MASWLDLESWPRRATFEFFKTYELPFFGVTAPVEVGPALRVCREVGASFSLAAWYACLLALHEVEPFRYRLRGDRVIIHDTIHIGTTAMLKDESFKFCYFNHAPTFALFHAQARAAIDALQTGAMDPLDDRDDLIHGSVLPWIAFTGLTHARRLTQGDSTPKIAFGKYTVEGDKTRMPVSVEAHHALMDGLHTARFLERFEHHLAAPEGWLRLGA